VKRREFITLLGGAAASWPFTARAQQYKRARIGALYMGLADSESFKHELHEGLRELGYVEDQTSHSSFALPKETRIVFLRSPPNWSDSRLT
jgi:hypothetical protein